LGFHGRRASVGGECWFAATWMCRLTARGVRGNFHSLSG